MPAVLNDKSDFRKILYHVSEFVLAAALIANCRSIWNESTPTRGWIGTAEVVVLILAVIACILISKTYLDLKRIAACLIVTAPICAYFVIYIYIDDSTVHHALRTLIAFGFLMLFYFMCVDKEQMPSLLSKYAWLMTVIAAVSLVCWLLFSILKVSGPTGVVMDWWNDTNQDIPIASYYNIYYEPQAFDWNGMVINKNCAIFLEAPMAALQFSFALFIEFFLREKTSVIRSIILVLALISTFATTAFVMVGLAVIVKLIMVIVGSGKFKAAKKGAKTGIVIAIIVVCVVILAAGVLFLINEFRNGSGNSRLTDFIYGFKSWSNKWIIGNGYNSPYVHSNSLAKIFADGGIWFAIAYLLPFVFGVIRAIKNKDIKTLMFILLTSLIIAVTFALYTYIVIFLIMFFGLYKSRLRAKVEEGLK